MLQNSIESPANLTGQNFVINPDGNQPVLTHQNNEELIESAKIDRPNIRATTCTGFQIANWQKALEEKKGESNRYFKGNEISMFAPLEHFKIYGSGIYLFFSFLWSAVIFFIVMSLIALIPIIYNFMNGQAFEYTQPSFSAMISSTSLGHYDYFVLMGKYRSQADSISQKHKILNVIVDLVNCAVFVLFIFYWEWKSEKIEDQIAKDIKLLSENTLEVIQFPQNTNPTQIQEYMNRYGAVVEVAPVKNYQQKIYFSKKIFEVEMKIKEIHLCATTDSIEEDDQIITKLQNQKAQLEEKLQQAEQVQDNKYIKFYVTFQRERDRNLVLKTFERHQTKKCLFFKKDMPEQLLMNGKEIVVQKCVTEPAGIIWENVHMTWKKRFIRSLLQVILILALLTGGFIAISLLNIYSTSAETNINTSTYTWETIQSETNITIVEAWCLQKYTITWKTEHQKVCGSYWEQYELDVFLGILISFIVVAAKLLLNFVVVKIAKFQRYTDHTEQSVAIMTNLLVTSLSTTVLITFLMQAVVFDISFLKFIFKITNDPTIKENIMTMTEYSDLTNQWYYDIGYQLWLNLLIDAFLLHCIQPLIRIASNWIKQWLGKKQKLHKNMMDSIRSPEFQIQEHYAQILMAILVGIIFGGGMAIFIPVVLLGLATRYFFLKIDFIRFCRVPVPFGSALNNKALHIIKGAIIARGILSIYMYGANGVFLVESSTIAEWDTAYNYTIVSEFVEAFSRFLQTWYYTLFLGIFIIGFIGRALISEVVMKKCLKKETSGEESSDEVINNYPSEGVISQRTLTKSYRLQKNPDYIEILAIIKMKARKQNKKSKQVLVQGTPS